MSVPHSARIVGNKADVDYVLHRLESVAEGPVKIRPVSTPITSINDEPRIGQYELLTYVVDFVLGIGGNAAYDLLKKEVIAIRGRRVRIEDEGNQSDVDPHDDDQNGGPSDQGNASE